MTSKLLPDHPCLYCLKATKNQIWMHGSIAKNQYYPEEWSNEAAIDC